MATYDFDLTAICEKPKRGALPTPEAIPKMKAEKLAKCLKDYGRAHPNVANAVFLRAAELTERERKYKNTKTKLDLSDENEKKL